MQQITTIGIDLAKNVFQIHGADQRGKPVLRKQLRRDQVAPFFANLQPCLVGIEACSSTHHWARKLQDLGPTVRLMAPQFVKPYVKSNKSDAADAEAICEAVGRPTMRFVPIKNAEQQSVLSLHRVRQAFVKARPAQANQIRGLLAEYGLIVPKEIGFIATRVPDLIEDASNELPGLFRPPAHAIDLLQHAPHVHKFRGRGHRARQWRTTAVLSASVGVFSDPPSADFPQGSESTPSWHAKDSITIDRLTFERPARRRQSLLARLPARGEVSD